MAHYLLATTSASVIREERQSHYMPQDTIPKRESLKLIINDILEEKDDASTMNSLNDNMSLTNDLGLESLDLAEMTVRLEDKYGIDVFEEDIVDEIGEVLEKLDS